MGGCGGWVPGCEHGWMGGRVERIKACLNGGRGRAEHPAVPVTPSQLAAAAVGAVAAGAEAVHLHPRGRDGVESLQAGDVGSAVAAVRQASAGISIGVSTGLWITRGDPEARLAAVAGWAGLPASARPDFASVNICEPDSADLLPVLHTAGIAVEAGVWSVADARAVAALRPAAGWLRILVEVVQVVGVSDAAEVSAVSVADQILHQLAESGVIGPRLLHGEQATCWPLISHAGRLGLPTRIGLEDTTVGPDGGPASDNAELVQLALAEWTAAAHTP
jgi:uncharacterized protein (DUF849 family)